MFTLILTLAMHAAPAAPVTVAEVQTCQWPNKCVSAPIAEVQTCQWPNKCAESKS